MDFKRALVSSQKGIYCKLIRHLLEAKRPCIELKLNEISLQSTINKGNKLFVVDGKGMIDKNNMFFSTMTLYFTPSIATFDTNKSYNTDI